MRATQSFFLAVENDAAVPAGAASMLAAVQDESMLQSISAVLDMMLGLIHGLPPGQSPNIWSSKAVPVRVRKIRSRAARTASVPDPSSNRLTMKSASTRTW